MGGYLLCLGKILHKDLSKVRYPDSTEIEQLVRRARDRGHIVKVGERLRHENVFSR